MERRAMSPAGSFCKHTLAKHERRGKRKSEEQKLIRLKKLLHMKVQSGSVGIAVIRED